MKGEKSREAVTSDHSDFSMFQWYTGGKEGYSVLMK